MYDKNRELLATKLITPLQPLYKKEFPLLFFWSPKSGCTTLIKWFFFQIGILQTAIGYNPWIHFYREEVYEKQENHKLEIIKQLLDNKNKKYVYKLVRNPYNRAVSSFFALFANEHIRNQIFPYGIHNGVSFKQFLYQVKNIGVKKGLIDIHIAQQYVEEEELFIQNYVQLEQFSAEIRNIEKKYNLLESPIQNIIKSHHHRAQQMTDMDKQTFAEVNMSMKILSGPLPLPHYKNFYDDETRDIVRELFIKDFKKYGYNQNDL